MKFKRSVISALASNVTDGEHASVVDDIDGNYFLLSNKNIKDGKVIYDKSDRKINFETFKSINRRTKLCAGDVIISTVGSIGRTAIIKDSPLFFDFQRSVGIIKPNTEKLLPEYLHYYFQLSFVQKRLINLSKGAVQRCLFISDLNDIEIDHPENINDQKKLISILSIIDSKIELNNRINAELEGLTKTLYDYWFVQFDFPNENRKPYKTNGGKMIWNDELKREIPLGWEVKSIEDCCKIIDCLHSKKPEKKYEDEEFFLLQLENLLDNGLVDTSNKYYVTKEDYLEWTSRIEVMEHDILITNAGRVAATVQVGKGLVAGIGRNITAIRPVKVSPTYLFLSFYGFDIIKQIKANTDSGAFFSSFNVKGIKQLKFLIPSSEIESDFENIVYPLRRKRENNLIENQKLAELRDWLLPMLMNGQVKVN